MQNSQIAKWLDASIPRPKFQRVLDFFETRDLNFCRRVSYGNGAQTRTLLGVLPASGFMRRRFLCRKNILSIGRHPKRTQKKVFLHLNYWPSTTRRALRFNRRHRFPFPDAYLRVRICSLSELQAPSSKTKCLWRRRKPSVLSEDVVQLLNLSTILGKRSWTFCDSFVDLPVHPLLLLYFQLFFD